jgi:hypothetical protein
LQTQAFSAKVITASGCNLAYTATADAIAAKLTDSTAVEPLSADGEVAVEAAEVKSDAGAAKVNLFTAGDNFNVAGNATAGTKANDTEAAAAEIKCKGIQIADVRNVEGVSPTAWQPVRDMNSAKVGVAVSVTVTVNVNVDTQNVDGMKSAEVGAAVGVIQFGLCKYVTCESANSGNGLSGACSIAVNSVTQVTNADRVLDKVFTDTKTQENPQFAVTKTATSTYIYGEN